VVDAKKQRYGRDDALALLAGVRTLLVARGKKVTRVDLGAKHRPDDDTLAALLLGPTGNLRAPTLKSGRTMLVGFNADMYADLVDHSG
jgi:arsenate reductase-like glutaredoxin family protein